MRELDRLGVTRRCCTADETDRRRRLAVVRALLPELDRHVDPDPVGATVACPCDLAACPPAPPTAGQASPRPSRTIVSLVGDGLINTEIGERLYVSRRTVESHLGRVYVKLGLATRGQLVSAAVRHAGG